MLIFDNVLKAWTGLSTDDKTIITFPNTKLYLTDIPFWQICGSDYKWVTYTNISVAVVVPDGSDSTQGSKADAAMTDSTQPNTIVSILKGIFNKLGSVILSAGSAIIGKVGIDQTTDGTTNRVVSKISQTVGENTVTLANGQNVGINVALPAGTNNIGKVTIDSTTSLPSGSNIIGRTGMQVNGSDVSNINAVPVSFPNTPTVNIGTIPEVEVKNDVGNPIPVNGTVSINAIPTGANIIGNVGINGTPTVTVNPLPTGVNTIGAVTEVNLDSSINTLGLTAPTKAILQGGSDGTNIKAISTIPNTGVISTPISGTQSTAITTATTTTLKASAGVVGTVINAGSATSGIVTIYDNTTASGKLIWAGTLIAGQVLQLGVPCGTGITVVTAAVNTILVSFA